MWNQNVSGSEYAPGAVAGDADLRRMGDVFCLILRAITTKW